MDFEAMIDKYIESEGSVKKVGRYYPSDIGKCIRKTWYTYRYPEFICPELRRTFEAGKILHDFFIQVMKSYRTSELSLIKSEIPFKYRFEDFVISGRIDHLVLLNFEGKIAIVEVKSSKNVGRIENPMRHHVTQLQFYMYATGVHRGILVYVDKVNLSTKSFDIDFSEKSGKRILEKFCALNKYLKNSDLPAPEAKRNNEMGWMCDYCEYREKCEKGEV